MSSRRALPRACRDLFLFLLLFAFAAAPAIAEKRVALVIGNAAYTHAPALANPRNDAEAMAAALKRLSFDVIAGFDLDEAATRRLLRDLSEKLDGFGKDDVAVLFYAGHGLQVNGRNYLVPVDAKLERERDLDFQAVPFDFIQQLMEKTQQTNIVMLDSCRDNPLARTLARGMGTRSTGVGRGLAEMRGINDTLIVYATNPGNVALDGQGRNSPFTEALLKHIERPGLEVRHMIAQVRAAVIAATKGDQVPWEAASLTRQLYLAAAAPPPPEKRGETPAPAPAAPRDTSAEFEILFWQSIKDSKDAEDYRAYLARFPNGTFAQLARGRIASLAKPAAPPAPPAPAKPAERDSAAERDCDRHAAHPDDTERPAGVPGIAFERMSPTAAIEACRTAMEARPNDPRLQFQYARALNADRRMAEALEWYERAARAGHAQAEANLGWLLFRAPRGVGADLPRAIALLESAARKANPDGHRYLGDAYTEGRGAPHDLQRAYYHYRVAQRFGNREAAILGERVGGNIDEGTRREIAAAAERWRRGDGFAVR